MELEASLAFAKEPDILLANAMQVFTYLGLIVFAMSGGIRGRQSGMDLFGVLLVGFVTAAGGGTLRDVLIGSVPVNWVVDPWPLAVIVPSTLLAYGVDRLGLSQRAVLNWVDALGMATFCVAGTALALDKGINPFMAVFMGTITATFGGLLRDILCNVVPFVLRQEIYATAALAGAGLFALLLEFDINQTLAAAIGLATAMGIRSVALYFKLNVKPENSNASHFPE